MENHGYRIIADMKKDLHKMIDNALSYNKPKSQIHSDALRIRAAMEPYGNVRPPTDAQPTPSRTSARGGATKNPLLMREAQLRILEDLINLTDEKYVFLCSVSTSS